MLVVSVKINLLVNILMMLQDMWLSVMEMTSMEDGRRFMIMQMLRLLVEMLLSHRVTCLVGIARLIISGDVISICGLIVVLLLIMLLDQAHGTPMATTLKNTSSLPKARTTGKLETLEKTQHGPSQVNAAQLKTTCLKSKPISVNSVPTTTPTTVVKKLYSTSVVVITSQ